MHLWLALRWQRESQRLDLRSCGSAYVSPGGHGAQRRSESCARWIPWDIGEKREQAASASASERDDNAGSKKPS